MNTRSLVGQHVRQLKVFVHPKRLPVCSLFSGAAPRHWRRPFPYRKSGMNPRSHDRNAEFGGDAAPRVARFPELHNFIRRHTRRGRPTCLPLALAMKKLARATSDSLLGLLFPAE